MTSRARWPTTCAASACCGVSAAARNCSKPARRRWPAIRRISWICWRRNRLLRRSAPCARMLLALIEAPEPSRTGCAPTSNENAAGMPRRFCLKKACESTRDALHRIDHVRHGEAEVLEQLLRRCRGAERGHADHFAVQAHVLAPEVGDA